MATISNSNIAEAIFQSSEGKHGAELSKHLQNVVKFLSKRRLMGQSENILGRLKHISNKKEKIVEVNITSAEKINTATKHELETKLKHRYSAHQIVLNEKIDQSLIGGFRIEAGDEVIDLTLKNKISKLEEYLTSI